MIYSHIQSFILNCFNILIVLTFCNFQKSAICDVIYGQHQERIQIVKFDSLKQVISELKSQMEIIKNTISCNNILHLFEV